MQWLCKIGWIFVVLAAWLGRGEEPAAQIPTEPQLLEAETAAEWVAEVRRHCHLNLPSSFESLPSSARLQMRTPAKSHTSRYGDGGHTASQPLQGRFTKSYGGFVHPQTVTAVTAPYSSARLCRWII